MKKNYTIGLFLFCTLTFGQQVLPFTDAFSYNAGNLHTTAPWTVVGTANATDHIVLDGSKATFDGGGTDTQLAFTPTTAGTLFYKLSLKVISMAGVTDVNGGYFAGFAQNATTFGGTLWTKRVDDNTFNIGIETRTALGALTTYTAGTYTVGTTYTIVVSYTFNTASAADDVAKLWVNPALATDEATPLLTDAHVGVDLSPVASFFLRQDSATETPSVEIDNLKISTTFSELLSINKFDAIPGFSIYPNPSKDGKLFITSYSNETKSVVIFDLLGKQVLNTKTSGEAINIAALTTGAYFVKVTENGKTATRKLLVQ